MHAARSATLYQFADPPLVRRPVLVPVGRSVPQPVAQMGILNLCPCSPSGQSCGQDVADSLLTNICGMMLQGWFDAARKHNHV